MTETHAKYEQSRYRHLQYHKVRDGDHLIWIVYVKGNKYSNFFFTWRNIKLSNENVTVASDNAIIIDVFM